MYENATHRVEGRIVSISQPHVRPIVRGKAAATVEFGAKFTLSVVDGFTFLVKISWENYHEWKDLRGIIEQYHRRFGCYPESVHVDKIYRNRENRRYCSEHGIRISGPPLGRPPKEYRERAQVRKQSRENEIARIPIEGKIGNGKRAYGLNRIKMKLRVTSETSIAVTILVMNLEKIRKDLLHLLFLWLGKSVFRLASRRTMSSEMAEICFEKAA